MELKLLNKEELKCLYQTELVTDFPENELKPVTSMLHLMDRGMYDPLVVLDGEETMGYAMVWLPPDGQKGGLLDYFGVLRGKRNAGLGSAILALLAQRYGCLFGEVEKPNSGDLAEDDMRRRRIGFYERNGFRVLDYECGLYGVHYNCLYLGPETDDCKVKALHRSVYASDFPKWQMNRYIQIPLHPGEAVHPAPWWAGGIKNIFRKKV